MDDAPAPSHHAGSYGSAAPGAVGPVEHPQIEATQDERPLAAVAYVLTWLTGIIILALAKKEQRYARWHAIQAIGLGLVAVVAGMALNMLAMLFFMGGMPLPMFQTGAMSSFLSLGTLVWLAAIVLIVVLAVQAYQGRTLRLPLLATLADRYA